MSIGKLPEILNLAMLKGTMLVGRLGLCLRRPPSPKSREIY